MGAVRVAVPLVLAAGLAAGRVAAEVASPATLAAGVATAWSTGDCARVLALVGDPAAVGTPDGVHLAVARCAARSGDLDRAFGATAAVPAGSPLAPWARRVEAEVLLAGDAPDTLVDPARARRAEAALGGIPAVGPEVRLLRARALVAQGRGLEAREDLRALLRLGGETAAEARYWLARAAEDRGDAEAALTTYRASWTREGGSAWSDRSAARLAALGSPVLDLGSAAGRALAAERLTSLAEARRAGEALDLLHWIEAAGGPGADPSAQDESAWLRRRASVCFDGRDYACAVDTYARLGSPDLVADPALLFQHALATSRAGDGAGAGALYRALIARFPATSQADLASFKLGYLAFDAGRHEEAVGAFRTHLARYPASRYADEARWFAGWCAWRTGEAASAATWWERLLAAQPGSPFAPAAAYWRARVQGGAEERRLLGALLARWPESGAAWFAASRLDRPWSTTAAAVPPLPPLPRAWTEAHPAWATADMLLAAGLVDLAREALGPDEGTGADAGSRLPLARRLVVLGLGRRARALVDCRGPLSPDLREACRPRPHADVVAFVLEGESLDPYLPYAIMTAESGLDPTVTSPAGARGLMQVMPEVGARLHALRFPDRPYRTEDLGKGPYNAALGTTLLATLHRRYRERLGPGAPPEAVLPLVIAAYNAGEEAVDRWLEGTSRPFEPDAFAEDIPWTETRRYVARVLGYLAGYHRTYDPR